MIWINCCIRVDQWVLLFGDENLLWHFLADWGIDVGYYAHSVGFMLLLWVNRLANHFGFERLRFPCTWEWAQLRSVVAVVLQTRLSSLWLSVLLRLRPPNAELWVTFKHRWLVHSATRHQTLIQSHLLVLKTWQQRRLPLPFVDAEVQILIGVSKVVININLYLRLMMTEGWGM